MISNSVIRIRSGSTQIKVFCLDPAKKCDVDPNLGKKNACFPNFLNNLVSCKIFLFKSFNHPTHFLNFYSIFTLYIFIYTLDKDPDSHHNFSLDPNPDPHKKSGSKRLLFLPCDVFEEADDHPLVLHALPVHQRAVQVPPI